MPHRTGACRLSWAAKECMEKSFLVRGINPTTSRLVELRLVAATELDAKLQARDAGLHMVVVSISAECADGVRADTRQRAAGEPSPTPVILLVDDYVQIRETLGRLLRNEGYE